MQSQQTGTQKRSDKNSPDQLIPTATPLKAKPTFLGSVPLPQITASKTNPRTEFTDMEELTASVAHGGVIQPVLVRSLPSIRRDEVDPAVRYELISGERRLRASHMAAQATIPAMSVELSDEEVLELQIVENSQRADVHPMDEAEAFESLEKLLRPKFPDPLAEIAGRVGKTRAYVIRRMSLLNLPKSARTAFRKAVISSETAMLIARIPNAELRTTATEHIIKDDDLREARAAREFIEDNFMLSLSSAPFNVADATLLTSAGACGSCTKRTGNQRTLFADVAKADVCTDPVCFATKRDAHYDRSAAIAKSQGLEVLSTEASKKLFSHGDHLNYNSGYVTPDSKNYEDPKNRTWKQILGKNAPKGVLAKASSGAAIVLWEQREINRILKENPPKDMIKTLEAAIEKKEERREQRRKEAILKEARIRTHSEILGSIGKDRKERTLLVALVHALVDVRAGSGFVGKVTASALARLKYKSVTGLIDKSSLAELRSFVLECAIGDLAGSWKAQAALPAIATLCGVDQKAMTKAVQVEWEAKRQNRKKAK